MSNKSWVFPALVLTALAAACAGFGASHFLTSGAMAKLKADRDAALDCRRSGANIPPCPVIYRNTRIEWRDRIQTVSAPDRKQTQRIAYLSAELERAGRTIRRLEHPRRGLRTAVAYGWQNGTMMHPYVTYDRCPPGSVVMYDAGLSGSTAATRHSGDPAVCYVRTSLQNRVALNARHR